MSAEDQVRIIHETLLTALEEPTLNRKLALLVEAKRHLEAIYSVVWNERITEMMHRNERDWL